MKDKKNDNLNKSSRRSFVKGSVAVGAGLAAAAVVGPKVAKANSHTELALSSFRPSYGKLDLLQSAPAERADYLASVRKVVKAMMEDPQFANTILENFDSVMLVNLYNTNREAIEAITGKLDGRTKEGRYAKIIHASELMEGVSGFDGVQFVAGSEEMFPAGSKLDAYSSSSSSSSSSCSGCSGSSTLGCCIVHFWGWSYGQGGSCTGCDAPGE